MGQGRLTRYVPLHLFYIQFIYLFASIDGYKITQSVLPDAARRHLLLIIWSVLPHDLFVGDGKCVICDSYVRPCTLVRICDECNYGSYQGRCVICGGPGISDAYYCKECTIQEKDVITLLFILRCFVNACNYVMICCNFY